MYQYFKKHKEIATLICITAVAAILRTIGAINFGTFMYDDMFSVRFASMPLGEMFSFLNGDIHPPLYYTLLHFWITLFGNGDIAPRLLSVLVSIAAIPLLYALTKKILNSWIALATCVIYTLSYFQIFTATSVRMYPLLTFLGLASLYVFWLVFVEKKFHLWWLLLLTTLSALLTNLGAVFIPIIQFIWLLILWKHEQISTKEWRYWIGVMTGTFLLWCMWLLPVFLPQLAGRLQNDWFFQEKLNRMATLGVYDFFFLFLYSSLARIATATIIFSAPFMVLLWADKNLNKQINPNWFLFGMMLPGFITSVLLDVNFSRIFSIPYLAWYMIVAYWFWIMWQYKKPAFILVTIIWLGISAVTLNNNLSTPRSDWRAIDTWLTHNTEENDTIILSCFLLQLQAEHYLSLPSTPYAIFSTNDGRTIDQQVINTNCSNRNNQYNWQELEGQLTDTPRLIVIHEHVPGKQNYDEDQLHVWLTENGWELTHQAVTNEVFGPQLAIYTPAF